MLSNLEIIERCIFIFSKPGRFSQRSCARDKANKPVSPFDKRAAKFDIEGAIRRSAGVDDRLSYPRLLRHLRDQMSTKNPFDWNDDPNRTQRDVVRMFEDLADTYRFQDVA